MTGSHLLLDPHSAMPGFFVHSIMAPAIEVGGRLYPGLSNVADYTSVGTLLFVSTRTQRLSDYDMYHSYEEYSMGPFGRQWELVGTARNYLGHTEDEVTMESMRDLAGDIHTEGYAFSCAEGGVDFYVRGSMNSPSSRYAHYKLDVEKPDDFWRAETYEFVTRLDRPEWARGPRVPE